MDRYLDYPFAFDRRGRTAAAGKADHVRDMIHAVLFTRPGERVNRPDFGCGLAALLFEPNASTLAGEARFQVLGALQRWLGTAIAVEHVDVQADGETLVVTIGYVRLDSGERRTDTFAAGIGSEP